MHSPSKLPPLNYIAALPFTGPCAHRALASYCSASCLLANTYARHPLMAPAAKPSSHNKVLILASGGVAAAAVAAMAWKTLAGSAAAPILPPAERVQKLAHAEQLFASKFPNVRTVTAKEAQALLQQQPGGYVLVDVRNQDEQQVSMLQPGQPSSVLTQQQFEQQKAELKDKTAICYCTVGYRSGLYAQELQEQGIPAVNLIGGICAWTQEGLPLATAAEDGSTVATNKVHTYAARWAYHGEGYQPVYYGNEYVRMVQDELTKLGRRLFGSSSSSSSSSS